MYVISRKQMFYVMISLVAYSLFLSFVHKNMLLNEKFLPCTPEFVSFYTYTFYFLLTFDELIFSHSDFFPTQTLRNVPFYLTYMNKCVKL